MKQAALPSLGSERHTQQYASQQYPQRNTYGLAVVYVQNLLNTRMHSTSLWVDGVFGPKTDLQIRQFQATQRLKTDGIVGPLTLTSLEAGLPSSTQKRPNSGSMVLPRIGWEVSTH